MGKYDFSKTTPTTLVFCQKSRTFARLFNGLSVLSRLQSCREAFTSLVLS